MSGSIPTVTHLFGKSAHTLSVIFISVSLTQICTHITKRNISYLETKREIVCL